VYLSLAGWTFTPGKITAMLLHYIKNSFLFYFKRQHLPVILGTALSCGILTGALIVGDSVSYSLRQTTLNRLGKTEYALYSGERYFRPELADEIGADLQVQTAPVLQLSGIVMTGGGENRLNNVQINGVDDRFWAMASKDYSWPDSSANLAAINARLARKLALHVNDELVVRLNKIEYFPLDAPFAQDTHNNVALRVIVGAILDERQLGSFNLKNTQAPPFNVFIPLTTLQNAVATDKANMILVAESGDSHWQLENVNQALQNNLQLADAGLLLRTTAVTNKIELLSTRIFIEPAIISSVQQSGLDYQPVFTYFVNQLLSTKSSTPYSFISAPGLPLTPATMPDSCIILNQWAADDLQARIGDKLTLNYYVLGTGRDLLQQQAGFTVYKILPMQGIALDRDLMPLIPGLADADNCRDWEPGVPIDLDKIRKKDEDYWDTWRGVPKAYVTLAKAQELWGNRYGNLTALRFSNLSAAIDSAILANVKPQSVGLFFTPVRQEGLFASDNAQDFGGLFLGLSFFIIIAALVLTGLLFSFGLENRATETGLLLGLGFTTRRVKFMFFIEFLAVAIPGTLAGLLFGILYNQAVLWGLGTLWQDVVGEPLLMLHIVPRTLLTGFMVNLVLISCIIGFILYKQSLKSVTDLQRGLSRYTTLASSRSTLISWLVAFGSLTGVTVILLLSNPGRGKEAATIFFAAGSLLLLAALAGCYIFLSRLHRNNRQSSLTLANLGIMNSIRNKKNSLVIIGLLATGIFMVIGEGANRHGTLLNAEKRTSGTGGFAFWGETVSPVLHNLNDENGYTWLNFTADEASQVQFVQCRLKEGDEASCLNLNMVKQPRILGISPRELDRRAAFTFVKTLPHIDSAHPWLALSKPLGENIIPAIVDQTVLTWNLYKEIGDTLYYQSENGDSLKLYIIGSLANSVFQGHVLIADSLFTAKFPTIGGTKVFLADVPDSLRASVEKKLNFTLQNYGLELATAPQRLATFHKIENTYLSIFLMLGGLGLLLGSIGLGIVVIRNVLERRAELALLTAIGFTPRPIYKYIMSEYVFLLVAGIAAGTGAALLSILPVLFTPGSQPPVLSIIITIMSLFACGFLWIYLAIKLALRQQLLPALRNE